MPESGLLPPPGYCAGWGAMLVSLVISSALFLGDSVSSSLQQESAVADCLHGVRSSRALGKVCGKIEDGILHTKVSCSMNRGSRPVEIYGLDESQFSGQSRDAFANQALIEFLQKEIGEEFVIRLADVRDSARVFARSSAHLRQVHLKLYVCCRIRCGIFPCRTARSLR